MQNYWFADFHIMGCLSLLSFVILNHATPTLAETVEKKLSPLTPTSITQLIPESIPQESGAMLQGQVTSVSFATLGFYKLIAGLCPIIFDW